MRRRKQPPVVQPPPLTLDTRTFSVHRLIEDSGEFFGVEPFVARGAFAGYDPNATLTVDAARAIITAWVGHPTPSPTPPPTPAPVLEGGWRPPVATVADLPAGGNGHGDVRIVLSDFSIHVWSNTSQSWILATGAGGTGGGAAPSTPQTLFVGGAQPDPSALLVNSVWIPTNVDGTNRPVAEWQFYTGTGNGNGGNLFIQQTAPTPLVDALWIPTDLGDLPLYLDQWQVFTGRGSIAGVGNPNLYIGQALPASPLTGSLFVPLNLDETPKSPDQWRIYV